MAEQRDTQSLFQLLADPMDYQEAQQQIRDLTEVVLKQHEGRLKRLEDFMDGLMRKAG